MKRKGFVKLSLPESLAFSVDFIIFTFWEHIFSFLFFLTDTFSEDT